MKRFIFPVLVLFMMGLAGCKKLVSFEMGYDDNVTIPANSLINIPIDILAPQTTTNSEQQFENKGTASNLITEITLKSVDINIVSPGNANFNFLKSVEVFLSAPGLSEIRVAYHMDVPANDLQTFPLTCEDDDLKEYIKKPTYNIRVKAVTDENLTQDVEVNVKSRFTVYAGLV